MKKRLYCKTSTCRNWGKLNKDQYCPKCTSEEEQIADDCNCIICKEDIQGSDEKVIGCDLCENWYHSTCVGLPDELIKLINSTNNSTEVPSTNKLLGYLAWICPACTDKAPRNVTLFENSCELVKKPEVVDKGCSAHTNPINVPICKEYRYGKCQDGDNCEFSHPAKCLEYCRYGREGCSGGFSKCKLLHPVLCRGSLRNNQCLDQGCTLAHLKGTIRKEKSIQMKRPPNQIYGNKITHRNKGNATFSPYDSNKLGFLNYRQSLKNRNSYSGYQNNPDQTNKYHYNSEDYPNLAAKNDPQYLSKGDLNTSNPNPDQPLFLDLIQQLKSIQEAQYYFHQELMLVKSLIPSPPPQRAPNHAFQSHSSQQQMPVMQTQTNTGQV